MTAVIPTSGESPNLEPLLCDLAAQTAVLKSVHVVVNNEWSAVGPCGWHRTPNVEVSFLSRGHYYAAGVNFALRQVDTPYVALVNDDVRLPDDWVEAVLDAFDSNPGYGSVASRVVSLSNPGRLDSCGASMYLSGRATANGWLEPIDKWREPRDVFSAAGCLSAYRMSDLRRVGLLDERLVAYMEDVDLGFRFQLIGRPCLYWPQAEGAHIGGATRKTSSFAAKLAERNSVLVIAKNLPATLFRDAAPHFVRGHLRPCPFEGQRYWLAWAVGMWSALRSLPHATRRRKQVQAMRTVSDAYIRSILRPGQPGTCHL